MPQTLKKLKIHISFGLFIFPSFLHTYGECSKILNTFYVLFSNKAMLIRAGIHKILMRIPNREDPDLKKQSDLGLPFFAENWCLNIYHTLLAGNTYNS